MADDDDSDDVVFPDQKWVEIEVLEVGRVTTFQGEKFVALAISFFDPEVSDMTFFHKFQNRKDVETFISNLLKSTHKIWPPETLQ